jgi:hypothetical protein
MQIATIREFGRGSCLVLVVALLQIANGSMAATPPAVSPADTLDYTVVTGDSLIKICGLHRDLTNHYALTDLMTDIRNTNNLKTNVLSIGQKLRIPVLPVVACPVAETRVSEGAEMRGIYLTGPACGVSSVLRRVDRFIEAGGNAVVFDAKDIDGGVSFASKHELADWGKGRGMPVISSLGDMMSRFDRRDLYVVARIALFLDGELGRQRPDLALKDDQGNPWSERGCFWMDPSQPEVRQYNLTLAMELAEAGVDEIQFDYVRFPTNGWLESWTDSSVVDIEKVAARRRSVISSFLAEARETLAPFDVRISADLYGIMAWDRTEDLALTGQHVPTFAEYVDVICPMIYPSHFGPGFEGRKRPGDDPEYFISEGTRRFADLAAGKAEIRPWLQAFPYRVSQFDGKYIATQITASRLSGGNGWCLWNPACRYSVALSVIPDLCPAPPVDPMQGVSTIMVADRGKDSSKETRAEPQVLLGTMALATGAVEQKQDPEELP